MTTRKRVKAATAKNKNRERWFAFYKRVDNEQAFDAVEDPAGGPESVDYCVQATSRAAAEEAHAVFLFWPDGDADKETREYALQRYQRAGYTVHWHATVHAFLAATDLPRFKR